MKINKAISMIAVLTLLLTGCGNTAEKPEAAAETAAETVTTKKAAPETEATTKATEETTTTEVTTIEVSPAERAIIPPEDELIVQYDAALGGAIFQGYTGTEPDIRIPDTVGGDKIISVSLSEKNKKVKTLIIPEGVESVYCFNKFESLEYVELPSTVTKLPKDAFRNCKQLSHINLNNITYFGNRCLCDCKSLDHIDWADNIYGIEECAFAGIGITEIEVPYIQPYLVEKEDETFWRANVGTGIFCNCTELRKATVHNMVFEDGFAGCKSLEEINLVCDDEYYYSYQAEYLGKDHIQDYMCIRENGLKTCESLTTVNFINCKDFWIGKSAFYNCPSLRTLDLSNLDIHYIDKSAFENCPALIVTYNGKEYNHTNFNELYDIFSDTYVWSVDKITDKTAVSEESLHQTKLKKEGEIAYLPGRSIEITDADIAELEFVFDAGLDGNIITGYTGKNKNIRFPAEIDGVKTVGVKLPKTNNLNNIEMPDGVVTIDFENCPNLETVKLSTGLTTIPKSAFYECESLTSIDIPNGVTSIEDGAFSRCKALASVTLPNTLTTIGAGAFSSCGLEQLTIPSSVTEIGSGAFNYCESLKTVNFPDTPIAFGYNAFSNCIALEEITLPGGIGDGSGGEIFAYCNNLKKVTVYRTLSNAKYDATDYRCEDSRVFYLCSSLEEVVLISTPDSEFIIPSCAFEECSALKIIDTSKCDNLVLCDAILADCPSIQTISLPDNTRPIVNNINRVTPFYKANESLVVTYKGKEYNYTNFNEMFK